jgi:hypothetical protein
MLLFLSNKKLIIEEEKVFFKEKPISEFGALIDFLLQDFGNLVGVFINSYKVKKRPCRMTKHQLTTYGL